MLTIEQLCDVAVEHNLVPDGMFYAWEVFGGWQRRACDHFGGPRDKVILDIGCGPLRFGAQVVSDLGSGHFYGVEPFGPYVAIARRLAERLGAAERVTIIESGDFAFPAGVTVDFAMCHAVFTHVAREQVRACLERLGGIMRRGAPLVFTYNLAGRAEAVHKGRTYAEQMPMISVHLDGDSVFTEFAAAHGLAFRRFDEVPHPGQTAAVLTF